MRVPSLSQVSDPMLERDLENVGISGERGATAVALAYIAEFDARQLYLPAGYSCMHSYCVLKLHLSEDAAYKRIQAARAARQFPVLFEAMADGRLHRDRAAAGGALPAARSADPDPGHRLAECLRVNWFRNQLGLTRPASCYWLRNQ